MQKEKFLYEIAFNRITIITDPNELLAHFFKS
jgi:hypothetical protein